MCIKINFIQSKSELIIAWWNTSLSPPRGRPREISDREFAASIIKQLFDLKIDLFALGEVSLLDIEYIIKEIDNPSLESFFSKTSSSSGIAVIYNRDKVSITEGENIIDSCGSTRLKTAQRVIVKLCDHDQVIHLYISHWFSRLFYHEDHSKRIELGVSLRLAIDRIKQEETAPHYIILMGDYNDEPFSRSLADHLLASRDRELVKNKENLLYNPFWKQIGESAPYKSGQSQNGVCGTYFYKSTCDNTRWYTFDQMIFSSAFLKDDIFSLNEYLTQIVRNTELENNLKKGIFDHLPIMSVIDIKE